MPTDDRRAILRWLTGAAIVALGGCQTKPKPSSTATLLNNGGVNDAMKALINAVDNLASQVGGFDTENWRDVVPNVRAATQDVIGSVTTLRRELGYSG